MLFSYSHFTLNQILKGKAQRVYDNTKNTAEELKKIYEERLSQQEEEHESEIRGII